MPRCGIERQGMMGDRAVASTCPLVHDLERELAGRLDECAPDARDVECIASCLAELRGLFRQLGGGWGVEPYGSAVSGFSLTSSDLDVTCYDATAAFCECPQELAASTLRDHLVPLFQKSSAFRVVEEIFNAKVPILRLSFGSLQVDLSFNNFDAVTNSRLLKAYASMDDKVRQLAIAVKLWAKAANVCGASHCHLSSYAFVQLAIYFFQVQPDLQLPVLSPQLLADQRIQHARTRWRCHLSLLDLVLRFFRFFATEFVWGSEVVSIRCGARLFAREPIFLKLRGRWCKRLHIEDPCLQERNLNCVLGKAEELQLRIAFGEAYSAIVAGGIPVGLQSGFGRQRLQAYDGLKATSEELPALTKKDVEMHAPRLMQAAQNVAAIAAVKHENFTKERTCGGGGVGPPGLASHVSSSPGLSAIVESAQPLLGTHRRSRRPASAATAIIAARVAAVCASQGGRT